MKRMFVRAALAAVVALGAVGSASVAGADVDIDPVEPPTSGDWVLLVATLQGDEATWGWSANYAHDAAPFVLGFVTRATIDGASTPVFHSAFNVGENQHEVSTTQELGGAHVTLVAGTETDSTFSAGFGAFGFSVGDVLTQALYVPDGSFSSIVLGEAQGATVEMHVGTGAETVLGIADEVAGPGVHAVGVTAGAVSATRSLSADTHGTVLGCSLCRSWWQGPDGSRGGMLATPAIAAYDASPSFRVEEETVGDWTFNLTGVNIDPLGGRPVLGTFINFGELGHLFV